MILQSALVFILGNTVLLTEQSKSYCTYVDDGVCEMTREDAIRYCEEQEGGHLPSVRELAQIAMSYGAKGLRENEGKKDFPEIEGYTQYRLWHESTKSWDFFYYSNEGYQPSGPGSWVMSSDREIMEGRGYTLNPYTGEIFEGYLSVLGNPVRCMVAK